VGLLEGGYGSESAVLANGAAPPLLVLALPPRGK
jgi:hypothetical protein